MLKGLVYAVAHGGYLVYTQKDNPSFNNDILININKSITISFLNCYILLYWLNYIRLFTKVTAAALSEVIMRWWKALECSLKRTRGGVPVGAPTLKLVEIRVWGFREEEVFYLGDCIESPIYRGGELQSVVMAHPALAVTKSWEV